MIASEFAKERFRLSPGVYGMILAVVPHEDATVRCCVRACVTMMLIMSTGCKGCILACSSAGAIHCQRAVLQVQGFQYMLTVAEGGCPQNPSLQTSAQFNVGCAYNQGFGVRQSYSEAVRWWTQAAEMEGCSPGAVQAQNMLGMHYSRVESQNLRKVSLA